MVSAFELLEVLYDFDFRRYYTSVAYIQWHYRNVIGHIGQWNTAEMKHISLEKP